jgi:hypothetical protein
MTASTTPLRLRAGTTTRLAWQVTSAAGASLALATRSTARPRQSPTRRLAEVRPDAERRRGNRRREGGGQDHDHALLPARARRCRYFDVFDDARPVSLTVDVKVNGG